MNKKEWQRTIPKIEIQWKEYSFFYLFIFNFFIIIISEDILVKIYEFPFLIRKGNLILRVGGGNQIPFPSVT